MSIARRNDKYRWDVPLTHPEFIVRRATNDEYKQLIEVWNWCEATFGTATHNQRTWNAGFTNPSDDTEVTFTFYDEGMATLFALKWS